MLYDNKDDANVQTNSLRFINYLCILGSQIEMIIIIVGIICVLDFTMSSHALIR